jgi:chromosome segregation and condensation protein ScpB
MDSDVIRNGEVNTRVSLPRSLMPSSNLPTSFILKSNKEEQVKKEIEEKKKKETKKEPTPIEKVCENYNSWTRHLKKYRLSSIYQKSINLANMSLLQV